MLELVEKAVEAVPHAEASPVLVTEVPLLFGPAAEEVIARAAGLIAPIAGELLRAQIPPKFASECRALLRRMTDPARVVRAAVDGGSTGVEAFIAWKAISRALPPIDGSRWHRSVCPACGALPAMAELRENRRSLACGRCATRWAYQRIGCPYCGNEEVDKLSVLEPGDDGYRIDVCKACDGYLKTYLGEGGAHALSDWSTLHLDAACRDRGLQRQGPSLYFL